MNELETFIGPNGLPSQIFKGIVYQLQPADPRYFRYGNRRLHVVVWTHYNGRKPSKGFHIHHKDEDKHNNKPDNLEEKKASHHISEHIRKRLLSNPEYFKNLAKQGQKAASEWSRTGEGLAFRRAHYQSVLSKFHDELHSRTVDKKCECCGKDFKTTKLCESSSRFCSNACKSAYRRRMKLDYVLKMCIGCGTEYSANKYEKNRKYCSKKCAINSIYPNK